MPKRPVKPRDQPSAPRFEKRGLGQKKKASLYDLTKEFLSEEQVGQWAKQLHNSNDRTVVIIGSAALDQLLLWLLVAHFTTDARENIDRYFYEDGAVLGSFSSRITICHAFGWITNQQKSDLDNIRKIRNVFAHRIQDIRFYDVPITAICNKLTHDIDATDPRDMFITSVHRLYLHLVISMNKKTPITELMPFIRHYLPPRN